jgi:hypothetical protein
MILLNNLMRQETLGGRCLRRRGSRSREKLNGVSVLFPYDPGGVAWEGLTEKMILNLKHSNF